MGGGNQYFAELHSFFHLCLVLLMFADIGKNSFNQFESLGNQSPKRKAYKKVWKTTNKDHFKCLQKI